MCGTNTLRITALPMITGLTVVGCNFPLTCVALTFDRYLDMDDYLKLCSYLDPRFKSLPYLDAESKNQLRENIRTRIIEIQAADSSTQEVDAVVPTASAS